MQPLQQLIRLQVARTLISPVEAVQEAILAAALVLHAPDHPAYGDVAVDQQVGDQHQGPLLGFGDHLEGPGLLVVLEEAVVPGSHQHLEIPRQRPDLHQHGIDPLAIVEGDDHQAGPHQTGRQQDVAPAGIAERHLLPRQLGLAHPLGIEIQREKGDLLELEKAGAGLPGAPEAGDDDMLVLAEPRLGDSGAGQQGRVGEGVGQPQGPLHQPGGERNGDDADADEQGDHLVTEQAMVARQRQQHEAELADLAQHDAGGHGITLAFPHQPARQQHQQRLAQDEPEHAEQHLPPGVRHQRPLHGHADGDEEEPQQHVPKRLDVHLQLMAVVGLPQHHAGQEGPECHGEPHPLGQRRRQQGHQQGAEHEQLVGSRPRHLVKHHGQQPLSHREQDDQGEQPLEGGPGHLRQQGAALHLGTGQYGDHHQQRHHRQILKQQDAHPELGTPGMELLQLPELLDHHGGGGEGQGAGHHQRLGETQPPPPAEPEEQQ
ncbi:hypothetical protein D3C86_778830 [compost metagenome]